MATRDRNLDAEPFDRLGVLGRIHATQAFALFDRLPQIYLFVKDRCHRFIQVNDALWRLHGCAGAEGMLGRTDYDFHPPALAAQYVAEDRVVMESATALVDQPWLVAGADGVPLWYLFEQASAAGPRRRGARPVRRAAADRPPPRDPGALPPPGAGARPGDHALRRAAHRRRHGARGQAVDQPVQCEFARLLQLTPSAYLLRVRVLMARRRLEQTVDAIGAIALDCGFYDQSHFTRTFHATTGMRPRDYRRRFGVAGGGEG